jgi:hypothetical protein
MRSKAAEIIGRTGTSRMSRIANSCHRSASERARVEGAGVGSHPARTIDKPAVLCTLNDTGAGATAARLSVNNPEWNGRVLRIVVQEETR